MVRHHHIDGAHVKDADSVAGEGGGVVGTQTLNLELREALFRKPMVDLVPRSGTTLNIELTNDDAARLGVVSDADEAYCVAKVSVLQFQTGQVLQRSGRKERRFWAAQIHGVAGRPRLRELPPEATISNLSQIMLAPALSFRLHTSGQDQAFFLAPLLDGSPLRTVSLTWRNRSNCA